MKRAVEKAHMIRSDDAIIVLMCLFVCAFKCMCWMISGALFLIHLLGALCCVYACMAISINRTKPTTAFAFACIGNQMFYPVLVNTANAHTETIILCHFNNDTEQIIIACLLHWTENAEQKANCSEIDKII